ncbi:MAG: S-layer homology domain-containing protein [Chloroflexota bacterium]|nr:S-layer homology domain-containing protein [Chloroflexota bacterium]
MAANLGMYKRQALRSISALLLSMFLASVSWASAGASTIASPVSNPEVVTVYCVDDDGATTGPPCANGTPYRTIQEAIDAASPGDEVRVAVGTYVRAAGRGATPPNNVITITGGYAGGSAAGGWTVKGPATGTVLVGTNFNVPAGVVVTLQNLVVSNATIDNQGGTVQVQSGDLHLQGGTSKGAFNVEAGAKLDFSQGSHTLGNGTTFAGGGTVRVSGGTLVVGGSATERVAARRVELASGTLSGPATLAISNTLTWTGGTMSEAGKTELVPGATLSISGSAAKTLNSRTLNNQGTATWLGTGAINLEAGAIINNSGLFDAQNNATLAAPAPAAFRNTGTFRKSGSTGITTIASNVRFENNGGTVDVAGGTLRFGGASGAGASPEVSNPEIRFDDPNFMNSNIRVGSTSATSSPQATNAVLEFAGGTYNFQGSNTVVGDGIARVNGALLQVQGTLAARNLELASGGIDGAGALTVSGALNWSGGQMAGAGATNIANGASLNLSGSNSKNLSARTLNNQGTATWLGTGAINLEAGATMNNSGLFDAQNNASIASAGQGTFRNTGTFRKSASTGITTIASAVTFENDKGTVDVAGGTLRFGGASSASASSKVSNPEGAAGTIWISSGLKIGSTAAASAAVEFAGGAHSFEGENTVTGDGSLRVAGANLSLQEVLSAQNMELAAGTVQGTGTLSINGRLAWTGGEMLGAGVTEIGMSATMNVSGNSSKVLRARTLTNRGTLNMAGTFFGVADGATLNNTATGIIDLKADGSVQASGAASTFNNAGSMRKSGGAGTALFAAGINVTNSGTVESQTGRLEFASGYTQTTGTTRLNGGNIAAGGAFNIAGGNLLGVGTVFANVSNSGVVAPGASPGSLTVSGNYTQMTAGALNIEIGGPTAGTQHDALVVTGIASLAGKLNLSLVNGFMPADAAAFEVTRYASHAGAFGEVNGASLGNGRTFALNYGSMSMSVVVQAPAATETPTVCNMQFADIPATGTGSTFYSFVQCLACREIISGYACGGPGEPCNSSNDKYFRPGVNVTRGQISKMVALAANLTGPTGDQMFEDVAPGSTFYDPIQQLASRGYIGGYPCGTAPAEPCGAGNRPYFRPGQNTTRGQLSKIVSQSAQFNDEPGTQKFSDVPASSPFFEWINRLANKGVISGYSCGGAGEPCDAQSSPYFRPGENVTRGQTAKIVANTFYPGCVTP